VFDESGFKIGIAQNLADGLARLHRDGQAELIWIDAICIDQRHIEEQKQQVQMMNRVYSGATRVKIWLGLGDEASMADAFDLLEKCANPLNDDSNGLETFEKMGGALEFKETREWSARVESLLPDLDTQQKILDVVFEKPWFERLWAAQEVWLGKDHIILAGFRLSMLYEIICRGAFLLYECQGKKSLFLIAGVVRLLRLFEARCRGSKLDLVDFLDFQEWKASEERDRVFALLAISEIPRSVLQYFNVDYNKPVREVYMDAIRGIVGATKVLSILCCDTTILPNSPSWSQYWGPNALQYSRSTTAFTMLTNSKAVVGAHMRPDELRLAGRRFHTVDSVCEVNMNGQLSPQERLLRIMLWYTWSQTRYMRSRTQLARLITTCFSRYKLRDVVKFDDSFATVIIDGVAFHASNSAETLDLRAGNSRLFQFYYQFYNWADKISSDVSIDARIRLMASSLMDTKTDIAARVAHIDYGEYSMQDAVLAEFYVPWLAGAYVPWLAMATNKSRLFYTRDGLLGMARGDIRAGD
jgi:hypothetical protein